MVSSSGRIPIPPTKDRSILSTRKGKRWSAVSEELPVPKSSITSHTPRSRSCASAREAASGSVLSTLSVTSRWSRSGASPERFSASATSWTKFRSWSSATERLTETERWAAAGSASLQCLRVAHASRRTQRPMEEMLPLSSATAMNSLGLSSPRHECGQGELERDGNSRPPRLRISRGLTFGRTSTTPMLPSCPEPVPPTAWYLAPSA